MELKNKYIVFDTNMWLKILSSNSEIDRSLLAELQKNNKFGIYNVSLIEILMRFSRKNNFFKIKEILKYISENIEQGNLSIGNIYCTNFFIKEEEIIDLLSKDDQSIGSTIQNLAYTRFKFKSSIIALWIVILLELSCPAFANDYSHADEIVFCCENKASKIRDSFINYFYEVERTNSRIKSLREITNKVFNEILDEIAKETNAENSKHYILMKNQISKLNPKQSISYIFKGVYNSDSMNIYRNRIDRSLDSYFNSQLLKKIFYQRLNAFMQGECLQKNDIEDMLMLSVLEKDDNIVLVTDDNKMIKFLQENEYNIGNELHDSLLDIST